MKGEEPEESREETNGKGNWRRPSCECMWEKIIQRAGFGHPLSLGFWGETDQRGGEEQDLGIWRQDERRLGHRTSKPAEKER